MGEAPGVVEAPGLGEAPGPWTVFWSRELSSSWVQARCWSSSESEDREEGRARWGEG